MLDADLEIFVVYVAALEALLSGMTIHLFRATQVDKVRSDYCFKSEGGSH